MANNASRVLLWSFYAAIALLPATIAIATFVDHDLNVSLLFWFMELLLLLILSLAAFEHRGQLIMPKWWSVVLAAVVLATSALAASRNAIFPPTAWGHLAMTTTHFTLACAIFSLFAGVWQRERRTLLAAIMLSALTQVLTTFVLIGFASQIPDFNWLYFHGGVGNVRQLGFVGITLCALSAWHALTAKNASQGKFFILSLLLSFTFLNLIGGRASLGAAFLSLFFICANAAKAIRVKSFAIGIVVYLFSVPISMALIPPHRAWGAFRLFENVAGVGKEGNYSSNRIAVWEQTFSRFLEHPWIGHGEAQFVKSMEMNSLALNHPHNFVLQFLFQWGLIGSIAIFGLVGTILVQAWKYRAGTHSAFVPAFALLLAMTAMAFLEGNFYHVYPMIISAISLALLATVGYRRNSQAL